MTNSLHLKSGSITNGIIPKNDSSNDWKKSARQQIGLVLSKKFADIQTSFEVISNHKGRITYENFREFINTEHALNGFSLTENLFLKFYASLDPHKKGYISL